MAPHFEDNIPQNVEIYMRNVTLANTSLPQKICPAELEDKLTTYGTSAKQLVSFKNFLILHCCCREL